MSRRQPYVDPYVAMLNSTWRKGIGYGVIAVMSLVIVSFVGNAGSEGTGQFAPLVEEVRYRVGFGILCAGGISFLVSLWFFGQHAYFLKWPERFE